MGFRNRLSSLTSLAIASGPLLFASPGPGWAQIEEIVVTTRKREENLQSVPIAVSVINSAQIQRQGISDLADITRLTPSILMDTSYGPSDVRVTIRGLANTLGRSNLAFIVDGVDVTTENVISPGSGLLASRRLLNDVERIEVVKGPQSALYGRAAFNGAISYITKEPDDQLEGQLRVDAAEDGYLELGGAVGGPVFGDAFGLRFNGVYWTDDGHYTNSVSGKNVGGGEGFGAALTGVFTPTESIKVKARLEYSDDEYAPQPTIRIGGGIKQKRGDWVFLPYPQEALDAGLGFTDQSETFIASALGLADHGDGYYQPKTYGGIDGRVVTQSENPLTGEEYEGTQTQTFRASLTASFDTDFARYSSITGWTELDGSDRYDQDYQARGRPDQLISGQQANSDFETRQFSQELRFESSWDLPIQVTVGGLYWNEERDLLDQNFIISCLPVSKDPQGNIIEGVGGVCDGQLEPLTTPTGLISVSGWQEFALQVMPPPVVPGFDGPQWNTDTDHKSVYAMLTWDLTEQFKLTLESRYIDEHFKIRKPNHSSCANLGFTALQGLFVVPLASEAANPGLDVNCEAYAVALEKVALGMDPNGTEILDPDDTARDWAFMTGSENSHFHTPKVTVEWVPAENMMFYFYWAKAQKPGGINQLSGGGTPVTEESERFAPEKMQVYEVGAKTSWEAAGYLQFNTAFFLQDYTDKQVLTQILVDNQLQPRVLNASAAEVWGLELEATWQPSFLDGFTLNAAYTFLDPKFTDYINDTTSVIRAASVGECPVVYKGGQGPNPDDLSDPANGSPFCRQTLSGNNLERTPEHAFVGALNLQRPLLETGFDWFTELNATYQGKRFVDADNFVEWDDYWLVDLRLGLSSDDWDFIFYVDNLLDDDTLKTGGTGPDFAEMLSEAGFVAGLGVLAFHGPLPDPRVFGVRLNLRF